MRHDSWGYSRWATLLALSLSSASFAAPRATEPAMPQWAKTALVSLVNTNSGSLNPAGLESAREQIIPLFTRLGYVARVVPVGEAEDSSGAKFTRKLLVFEMPDSQPDLLIIGHLDTVFEASSSFQRFSETDDLWRGPGVADMKGCLVMVAHLLEELGDRESRARFRILINDDEERGSPNSGPVLKQYAAKAKYGLIFESTPNAETDLTSSHSGVLWIKTTVYGVASHAGLAPQEGVSAILDNSLKMLELYKLTDYSRGRTVNAGVIHSSPGAKSNVVSEQVVTDYDIRYIEPEDLELVRERFTKVTGQLMAPNPSGKSVRATVLEEASYGPAMPPSRTQTLLKLYSKTAQELGMKVTAKHKGAVDNYGILETPIELLSGLGFYGSGMHSPEESARSDLYGRKFAMNLAFMRALVKGQK